MTRVLFVWEMGENLGHLARDLPVARRLRESGHSVAFVVKNLRIARALLEREGFHYLQAPRLSGLQQGLRPACYSEILLAHGYSSQPALFGLLKAWQQVFSDHKPDVVVANHAPTAVLAARCVGLSTVATCIGFELPPASEEPVAFRAGIAAPERLLASDQLALANINAALAANKAFPITKVSAIYSAANVIMTTYPELDHYGSRPLHYVGPVGGLVAPQPVWPVTGEKKIFCYLREESPHFDPLIKGLGQTGCSVLCVAPGFASINDRHTPPPNVVVSKIPVDVASAVASADLVVTHGTGTMHDALAGGRPLLLAPNNIEQYMAAARVVALGAGLILPIGATSDVIKDVLERLLVEASYQDVTEQFSAAASTFAARDAVSSIINRIETAS